GRPGRRSQWRRRLLQDGFKLEPQPGQVAGQRGALGLLLLAQIQQFVGDVNRGKHGQAVEPGALGGVAQLAHACIQKGRRLEQAVALLGLASEQEFAIGQFDGYRFAHAHAPPAQALSSSDFSRWIMASTRLRACSLRAIRLARSPLSCSWLWRRPRFSSLRRCKVSSSRSTVDSRAAISASSGSFSLIGATIAGGQCSQDFVAWKRRTCKRRGSRYPGWVSKWTHNCLMDWT